MIDFRYVYRQLW